MKTAVIWNDYDQLRYFVVDEDWSRFHDIFINSVEDEELWQELHDLVYDDQGEFKVKFVTIGGFADAIVEGAIAIECGSLP